MAQLLFLESESPEKPVSPPVSPVWHSELYLPALILKSVAAVPKREAKTGQSLHNCSRNGRQRGRRRKGV